MERQALSRAEQAYVRPDAGRVSQPTSAPAFVDNRPRAVAMRKLSDALHDSPRMAAQRKLIESMNAKPVQRQDVPDEEDLLQGQFAPVQRMALEEEDLLQGKFELVQRQGGPEEEELLQGKFEPVQRAERETNSTPSENNTGLPDHLKSGIESLSGFSLDNVKVHYNSSQPAQLNALAYAQGSDIHVAPGQERHLPHEAWHVVQQAQGRVQPTMQMKDGVPVNDDQALEREADVMGARAKLLSSGAGAQFQEIEGAMSANEPIQRQVPVGGETSKPVPNTGSYQARGGTNIIIDSAEYPRSKFSFGSKTRAEVFQRYNPQYVGNRIVSIRSSHGEQVNVEGVQLDHQVSWDRIAAAMTTHNKAMSNRGERDKSNYYTLWDAKMYYNDQQNLLPALAALNASGGTEGVGEVPRIHYGLESVQGTLQTSWMNLQAGLVAVGGGMSEEAVEEVATLMLKISSAMNDVTERLL